MVDVAGDFDGCDAVDIVMAPTGGGLMEVFLGSGSREHSWAFWVRPFTKLVAVKDLQPLHRKCQQDLNGLWIRAVADRERKISSPPSYRHRTASGRRERR
eukprot:5842861-Pyramimonas_sp.AAC.1